MATAADRAQVHTLARGAVLLPCSSSSSGSSNNKQSIQQLLHIKEQKHGAVYNSQSDQHRGMFEHLTCPREPVG